MGENFRKAIVVVLILQVMEGLPSKDTEEFELFAVISRRIWDGTQ